MKNKKEYTGSKVKNQFTAYLLDSIRGRRSFYLEKKIKVSNAETLVDEVVTSDLNSSAPESLEQKQKEELLLKEAMGIYPEWDELTDQRLVRSLMRLSEEERKLIYQHVFEERTFDEMSRLNGITSDRAKGIYYYAIRKIRKMMGGK